MVLGEKRQKGVAGIKLKAEHVGHEVRGCARPQRGRRGTRPVQFHSCL